MEASKEIVSMRMLYRKSALVELGHLVSPLIPTGVL